MKQYNVAILGAGVGSRHLDAYLTLDDRFSVKAICDLDQQRAGSLAHRVPGCRVSDDMYATIEESTIDIVDVCLPPHLHFEACSRALAAGKQVICEKPLVSSLRACDAMIAESDSSSGSVFPVFQYRYGRASRQLRALIDGGLAGKPYIATLETHWNRGDDYYAIDWRGTWAGEQGGAVLTHAIHIHDWLSSVLGPAARVYAELATRVNAIEVEDCAALTIRMASGVPVTSSITLGAANDTSRLRFCFERLTVESGRAPYAPATDEWTFTAREPGQQAEIDAVVSGIKTPASDFAGLFEAIADSLDGNPGSEVTLVDARRSLEFVTAVYHSMNTKAPVTMPLDRYHPLYGGWAPEPVEPS